eukprot:1381823-Amphidinium_carterae.1
MEERQDHYYSVAAAMLGRRLLTQSQVCCLSGANHRNKNASTSQFDVYSKSPEAAKSFIFCVLSVLILQYTRHGVNGLMFCVIAAWSRCAFGKTSFCWKGLLEVDLQSMSLLSSFTSEHPQRHI